MSVLAQYDGRCSICDEPILADLDQIVCEDDEWVHEGCVDG